MKRMHTAVSALTGALSILACFLISACAPTAELEEQNALLKGSADSLRRENYDCALRNARLAEQVDSLKKAPARPLQPVQESLPPRGMAQSPAPPPTPPRGIPITGTLPPAGPQFQSDYQEALHQFQTKEYASSLARFRALAAAPANDLSDNCEYWSGECEYAMEQYAAALERFAAVLAYRESDKRDDALMMRGNCYLRLNDPEKARAEFQALVAQYPESEYAPRARAKLNSLPPR